jgi:tetratricopeptide (TPR) repeat protein
LGIWLKVLFPTLYFISYFFSLNVILVPLLFIWLKPWFYAPLFIALILIFRKRVVNEPKRRYEQSTDYMRDISFRKLIISLKTFAYYFRIGIFPTRLGMCHTYLHVFGLSKKESEMWYKLDRYFWGGVVLFTTLVVGLINKWDIFGLIWFTLLIAQWCNFMVLNHPICERYIYLANVGLMLMLAKVLTMIPFGSYLAVALLVYYVTRLWQFLPAYKTNKDYFKSNAENFPDIAIPFNQWGLELIRFGQPGSALDGFLMGLQRRPNDFRINYNIANLLIAMGRLQESVPFVNMAQLALDPKNNYDMWRSQVDILKSQLKTNGVYVN